MLDDDTESHTRLPSVSELLSTAVVALGGVDRAPQRTMAAAVGEAIATRTHLAVQAGTGTGKSLGYLIPGIRRAVETGRTVVVSTSTIALQRQLIDRDLPRLAEALHTDLGRSPKFAILKGRGNYLCRLKFDAAATLDEPQDTALFEPFAVSALGRDVKRINKWATKTKTGDRDEIAPGVTDRAWRQVSVSARECLGKARCPSGADCFAEIARSQCGTADVVVTNHALLAIDAISGIAVLPEHDVVLIDEAHDLVDRVTSAATSELSVPAITNAARRCTKLVGETELDQLHASADAVERLFLDAPATRWDHPPEGTAATFTQLRDAAWAVRTALNLPAKRSDAETSSARAAALGAVDDIHDTATRILTTYREESVANRPDVVWLNAAGERVPATLYVAPLSVSGLLRTRLFERSTVVLTSATLQIGGSFDGLARQWGLPIEQQAADPDPDLATAATPPTEMASVRWTGLDVGSPFDHAKSAILYVAKHLPAPGRDGLSPAQLNEIHDLVTAAGGRTLGLFSSMRAARAAAEDVRERVDFPVLCQGDDATGALIKKFAAHEQTCLFGTLSLWQGVDVPGPSLSLVIVDRIPFPRPDDPLSAARQRAVDSRGGNGFMSVAATHAALLLAQGTGRLLRSVDDRGVIAILDSRLATARYGNYIRASLPPYWTTTDPELVRAALKRLAHASA